MQGSANRAATDPRAYLRVELLAGVATDLLRYSDPEQVVASVFERLSSQSQVDFCLSYLARGQNLQLAFAAGVPEFRKPEIEMLSFGEGISGIAARDRVFVNRENLSTRQAISTSFLRSLAVQTACAYPLLSAGKLLGTVCFGSREKSSFNADDFELLHAVADQVALAFDRICLIEELARNNQKLIASNAELRRANTELEQIAFSAAHDFREPVRHVSIYSELLARKLLHEVHPETSQYLQFISAGARRLERMVDDFVQLTRIARNQLSERETDTNAVLTGVLTKLQRLVHESGAQIQVRPLPPLHASEAHLEDLFQRLIENAIVHKRPDSIPAIEIFAAGSEKGGPVICVRDNGPGIDAAHQDTIFGLFKRLYPNGRLASGIGLTVCRKIVERYNGHIWVESELGKGALFCFTLGRHDPAAPNA